MSSIEPSSPSAGPGTDASTPLPIPNRPRKQGAAKFWCGYNFGAAYTLASFGKKDMAESFLDFI